MTDPAEPNEKPTVQPSPYASSPYAPPAILDENLVAVEGMRPQRRRSRYRSFMRSQWR